MNARVFGVAIPPGGVTACLAREVGSRQVTVNTVSPGMTQTEGLIMPEEQIRSLVDDLERLRAAGRHRHLVAPGHG